MTMAEMQFFEIPDKVTINEYIEIAKIYGSEKSHEFINGIIEKLITQNQITLDS
jgi:N utilization substance protein B